MTSVAEFDYHLPPERIAQTPVEPRHSARLLDTRDLSDHTFLDLPHLLRRGDLVVVNRTRVRAARLKGHKAGTGGRVEVLLLRPQEDEVWEALVRPARRLRPGSELTLGPLTGRVLTAPQEGICRLRLTGASDDLEEVLERVGEVPLPPYITRPLDDPSRYQTIFADRPGSAAAPTAGLHFTPQVVERLQRAGVELASVDLEVGLDTFRPITAEEVEDHNIHSERYRLDEQAAAAVTRCRERGGRVVAIGTTVVRTLETCADTDGSVTPGAGATSLYITPGFRFRVVDLLVTNFHVPRSSLLVLIAAFMGDRWRQAYEAALERGYRFLSFGDAMLAERVR